MSNRFFVPDDSPPPSTPDRSSRLGSGNSPYDDMPSTTPAGPPPSSGASFTPAGAPSASFLGSSMMRGVTGQKPLGFGSQSGGSSGRTLFGRPDSALGRSSDTGPLGRSIRGAKERSRSGLSREIKKTDTPPRKRQMTYQIPSDEEEDEEDEDDDEDADADGDADVTAEMEQYLDQDLGAEDAEGEDEDDMFLDMRHDDEYRDRFGTEESDLMVLTTPAANERVKKEAEKIFRASTFRRSGRSRDFKFASFAKDLYTQMGMPELTESPEIILKTDQLVQRMYDEGIGAEEDPEKLDASLCNVAIALVELWDQFSLDIPQPEGEHEVEIGPPATAEPFQKAAFVAHLVLQLHHSRFKDQNTDDAKVPPLPETLFDWMRDSHNPFPGQLQDVLRHRPSPACHSLFWQALGSALIRGEVAGAAKLLRSAGWESVRKGARGELAYTGKALTNVQGAVDATCDMLELCPGISGNWDIWSSDWTLFRAQARSSLERLTRFAEGKDRSERELGRLDPRGRQSLAGLAREAGSQVPWDIYQQLQSLYDVVLGSQQAIVEMAQDWCEATIGLFGWWDETRERHNKSLRLSRSQSLLITANFGGPDAYADRLAHCIHLVVDTDFYFNASNPVEVALASVLEGNVVGVVGILRAWSLPIASAVAEIGALGQWLPRPERPTNLLMDALDVDDLEVLGMNTQGPDELDGIKDTTLVQYARELAGVQAFPNQHEGWELAIQVLGRMDSVKRSEETVGELLKDLLDTLDVNSSETVNRIWTILNDLGMMRYAEDTAEAFAELLASGSHRYGEALWYYALAHRPRKVQEVCNLLISYSLVQSAAYPTASGMDDYLKRLYTNRRETTEQNARKDTEAAQLLDRLFAGYGCLRDFYEERDRALDVDISQTQLFTKKRAAAANLVYLIASAGSNIRGGVYDPTTQAVVPQDFLLALLGECSVFVETNPTVITLEQMDVLLKAIEDVETVGPNSKVYKAAENFFDVVLASAQGLKGSQPSDLMRSMTSAGSAGSSFVLAGSSLLVGEIRKDMAASGLLQQGVNRGWDWRHAYHANTSADDVLRGLRIGLTRDLASLWLDEADNVARY